MNALSRAASAVVVMISPALAGFAAADYEVPNPAYAAPAGYYNTATGTAATLRMNLHNIISSMTSISYGDARTALASVYADPNQPGNILLVYSRQSISGTWDNGITWNREHLWPQSKLGISVDNSYKGPGSDLFELRPADSSTNSSRGNKAYGNANTTGGSSSTTNSFFPGDADKGDVARAMFYMATRYYTGSATASGTNLQLVNGLSPNTYQMGDLQSLLHWNYEDGVDNYERKANTTIYNSYQHNRNPFVDHPEYVWAVFGDSANDSQLSVAAPATNGTSSATANVGRVMKNGTFGTATVTLIKTGNTPTTFDAATTGSATLAGGTNAVFAGTGQVFDYGNASRLIVAGLNASTATTGAKAGTIVIHNTDLTSAAAGKGMQDGDDTITVSGSVLDKRVVKPVTSNFNLGSVITGGTLSSTISLGTTGDDDSTTRVTVAGSTATDANGVRINGTTGLFDAATDTSMRTLTGTFSTPGLRSGTLSLGVTTAENGGAGLTGEGAYSGIGINYAAKVLAHSNASFNTSADSNTISIDFGRLTEDSGQVSRVFTIANLITITGYTAGLDLTQVLFSGDSAFSSNAQSFQTLAAGDARSFNALFDTSNVGVFSARYTFDVSDEQDLSGAIDGTALTLDLTGQVVAAPEPAALWVFSCSALGLLMRRRHTR